MQAAQSYENLVLQVRATYLAYKSLESAKESLYNYRLSVFFFSQNSKPLLRMAWNDNQQAAFFRTVYKTPRQNVTFELIPWSSITSYLPAIAVVV